MISLKRMPIEKFITNFKHGFDESALIKCFTQGNCYHFAVILKSIYVRGRIVHDSMCNHFMLELDDRYYDIKGEVYNHSEYKYFEYMDELIYSDSNRYLKLMRDCVLKIDYFYGIDNEYCKEEII